LHVLTVAADGSLAGPAAPLDLRTTGIDSMTRPQGIGVWTSQ
jgi:hypothetical protein